MPATATAPPDTTRSVPPDGPPVVAPLLVPAPKRPITNRAISQRLLQYLLQYKVTVATGLLCGIGAGAVNTSIAAMVKQFIESLLKADRGALLWVCVTVVIAYAVMGALKYGQSVLLATVAQRVGLALRRDIYAHLQTLSLSYFHRRQTGALLSTLTADVPKLQNAAMMLKDVIVTPVQALMILGFMIHLAPMLTLFSLVATPMMAWAIQRLTRRLRTLSQETQAKLADVAAVMEETVASPRIVRAFTAESHEVARFEGVSEQAIRSQLRAVRRSARLGPVVDVIGAVGVAAVLYVGGNEVLSGRMKTEDLFAFFLLVSNMANTVNAMGSLKSNWEEMMGAADRIFTEVLDVTPEIQDAPNARVLPPVQGRVEFRRVGFAYNPGIPVLSDIDLTIEPGQMVAFVGETGAGKSTLADLLPRFYDPTEGAVLVDGHDLRTITLASLRQQIAIVPQETLLFSGTVRDNIAYGKRDATDAEIEAAARAANAATFIEAMPDGYGTRIGERGTTLSGGQRQRIAIARALLANPRILILDEATSALDAATEALVQEALDTLMQGRTTIIIAHRLSTIIKADKIVVLKRGGYIAEMGTHAELLERGGVYAALFETQRRSAEGMDGTEHPGAAG